MRDSVVGILLFCWLGAPAAYGEPQSPFQPDQSWQCPLTYVEPEVDPLFLAEIDPLIVLAGQSCMQEKPRWLDRLNQLKVLRDKWIELHNRAKNVGPMRAEISELSKQIVGLSGQILVEMSPIFKEKNLCGVPLNSRLENLVTQTVKTIYSCDQHLREASDYATQAAVLPDEIASVVGRIKELWGERRALREKWFLERSCPELARQKKACDLRQAGNGAGAGVSEAVRSWEPDIRKKITSFKKASTNALDGKNMWDGLKEIFKGQQEEPNPLQTYHDHVIPMLRMCGMMRLFPDKAVANQPILNGLKKAAMLTPKPASTFYRENCSVFFCDADASVFQTPRPGDAIQQQDDVCKFAADYPHLEKRYMEGFLAAVAASKKGKPPASYCLPSEKQLRVPSPPHVPRGQQGAPTTGQVHVK